jgi:hypothetical protein
MKIGLSHTKHSLAGYALVLAALCANLGLQGVPIINKISKTIYVRQGAAPAPAGTSLQKLPEDYQKITPGGVASLVGREPFVWVHSGDQNNNLGKPTVFDLSSPISGDRHSGTLKGDLDIEKIVVVRTKLSSDPTATTKLILIGTHKHQWTPAVYALTKSPGLTKDASGRTVPTPGVAHRSLGVNSAADVERLLYTLSAE